MQVDSQGRWELRFLRRALYVISCMLFPLSFAVADNDGDAKLLLLRNQIDSLNLEESRGLGSTTFCSEILSSIRSGRAFAAIPAVVEAATYDDSRLSEYRNKCPTLELNVWESPPPSVLYRATRDFKVFVLPRDFGDLKSDRHFLFYAEGYFSPEEKERFKNAPQIYPSAGYAYSDGSGGGGVYSVIDSGHCAIGMQLIVHGRYNFKVQAPTKNLNQVFAYRDALYVYDFYRLDGNQRTYGGLVIYKLLGPVSVRQVCAFRSSDSIKKTR